MNTGIELGVSTHSSTRTVAYAYSLSAGYIWLASFNHISVSVYCWNIRDNVSFLLKEGV